MLLLANVQALKHCNSVLLTCILLINISDNTTGFTSFYSLVNFVRYRYNVSGRGVEFLTSDDLGSFL